MGRGFGARVIVLSLLVGAFSGCADDPKRKRVLVVGIDGARADATEMASMPNLDRLAARGAYTYHATTQLESETWSGPGWSSILTGVGPNKHLVHNNDELEDIDRAYPTFLLRAQRDYGLTAFAAIRWLSLLRVIESEATGRVAIGNDEEVTDEMAYAIRGEDYDVHFIHLQAPDLAGHETAFVPEDTDYMAAVESVDVHIGTLMDVVAEREAGFAEDWLILVTTDHGGNAEGHGPMTPECQTVFLVGAGGTMPIGELTERTISHMDVHPTVMRHLGVEAEASWSLDSLAIGP